MLTKVKKYTVTGFTVIGIFASGTFIGQIQAGANVNLASNIIGEANKEISGVAFYKKEELLENLREKVSNDIKEQIQPTVDEKKRQAETQLQEYYDQKVANITNEPEFQESMELMDTTVQNVTTRYQDEIDKAFAQLFQQ